MRVWSFGGGLRKTCSDFATLITCTRDRRGCRCKSSKLTKIKSHFLRLFFMRVHYPQLFLSLSLALVRSPSSLQAALGPPPQRLIMLPAPPDRASAPGGGGTKASSSSSSSSLLPRVTSLAAAGNNQLVLKKYRGFCRDFCKEVRILKPIYLPRFEAYGNHVNGLLSIERNCQTFPEVRPRSTSFALFSSSSFSFFLFFLNSIQFMLV